MRNFDQDEVWSKRAWALGGLAFVVVMFAIVLISGVEPDSSWATVAVLGPLVGAMTAASHNRQLQRNERSRRKSR